MVTKFKNNRNAESYVPLEYHYHRLKNEKEELTTMLKYLLKKGQR